MRRYRTKSREVIAEQFWPHKKPWPKGVATSFRRGEGHYGLDLIWPIEPGWWVIEYTDTGARLRLKTLTGSAFERLNLKLVSDEPAEEQMCETCSKSCNLDLDLGLCVTYNRRDIKSLHGSQCKSWALSPLAKPTGEPIDWVTQQLQDLEFRRHFYAELKKQREEDASKSTDPNAIDLEGFAKAVWAHRDTDEFVFNLALNCGIARFEDDGSCHLHLSLRGKGRE